MSMKAINGKVQMTRERHCGHTFNRQRILFNPPIPAHSPRRMTGPITRPIKQDESFGDGSRYATG